jgi:hypothetical protein
MLGRLVLAVILAIGASGATLAAPPPLTAGDYLDALHRLDTFRDMPEPGREQFRESHKPELDAAAMVLRRAKDIYDALLHLNREVISRSGRPILCDIDLDDDRDPTIDKLIDSYRARLETGGHSEREAAEQTEHTFLDHVIVTELLATHSCGR